MYCMNIIILHDLQSCQNALTKLQTREIRTYLSRTLDTVFATHDKGAQLGSHVNGSAELPKRTHQAANARNLDSFAHMRTLCAPFTLKTWPQLPQWCPKAPKGAQMNSLWCQMGAKITEKGVD